MLVLRIETSEPQTETLLSLLMDGSVSHQASVPFASPSPVELLENLRWLMEDFLGETTSAAAVRASAAREQLFAEGRRIFEILFESTDESRALWHVAVPRICQFGNYLALPQFWCML